jgi:hypothetical protein
VTTAPPFVPSAVGRYKIYTPDQAIARLTAAGYDQTTADAMVTGYLDACTLRYGQPSGGWKIDEYDFAKIERDYQPAQAYDPCAANGRGAVQSADELTSTAGLSPEATAHYWEDIAAGASPRDALAAARDVEDVRDVPTVRETDDSAGREFSDA